MVLKLPPKCNNRHRNLCLVQTLARMSTTPPSGSSGGKETKSVMVIKRPPDSDPHHGHYERNFITGLRAMQDFLLKPEHLVGLRATSRRSPNENSLPVRVYWRKDVEAKSIQVWGSLEAMEVERERLKLLVEDDKELVGFFRKILFFGKKKRKFERESWPVRGNTASKKDQNGLSSDSGKVVLTAIGINTANCVAKGIAWVYTGSHAMFSEMIHSGADTMNQVRISFIIANKYRSFILWSSSKIARNF